MNQLSDFAYEYYQDTQLSYRKKFGQYFTTKKLIDIALSTLPILNDKIKISELSCGCGGFIDSVSEKYLNATIEGFEIDFKLANYCKEKYKKNSKITIHHCDTLQHDFTSKKYHITIGNPPYFEFKSSKEIKKKYKEVIGGRTNIYSLFIKLGIDTLEDGGYLSYVVPTSMLSGAYFAKLRNYILKTCSIVDIIIQGEDCFDNALQNVMILTLKKEKNNGKFVFKHNGIVIFTPKYEILKQVYSKSQSLYDLGFRVKTGAIVWNQQKHNLSNNMKDTLLIWADNITNEGLSLENHKKNKPQYIKNIKKTENPPVILVNRITGIGNKLCLRSCVFSEENFVCENHVNVIYPTKSNCMPLSELISHIRNSQSLEVLKNITGNTQISKNELEKLFPIWI